MWACDADVFLLEIKLIRSGQIDAAFSKLHEWYPQIVQVSLSQLVSRIDADCLSELLVISLVGLVLIKCPQEIADRCFDACTIYLI